MSEPVRRNLLAGLDRVRAPQPDPTDAAIAAVAERHGFASPEPTPPPAPPEAATPVREPEDEPQQVTLRRRRPLLKRNQQFNVRLREDTVNAIYSEANDRNVPIAQVIEEMVETFRAAKERGER